MKAIIKETGEKVDVRLDIEAVYVEYDSCGPTGREFGESELEFINGMRLDDVKDKIDSHFSLHPDIPDCRSAEPLPVVAWLTRDNDGALKLHESEPVEERRLGYWTSESFITLPDIMFPDVSAGDSPVMFRLYNEKV